jgi:hypothetical protein
MSERRREQFSYFWSVKLADSPNEFVNNYKGAQDMKRPARRPGPPTDSATLAIHLKTPQALVGGD